MSNVAILTDGCAYFEANEAEALGIKVVPLNIKIANKSYKDGDPQITDRFLKQQEKDPESVSVSAPSVQAFEKAYTELHKRTDKILTLAVSSKLSDTFHQAQLGAEALLGRCTIEVLDTHSVFLGQGILVKEAVKAANNGASTDEIIRLTRGLIPHIYTVMYVDIMEYLEKSKTVGKAQAILGTMMKIKPMLFMEDGQIIPMEKVKTQIKAVDKLTEFVSEFDDIVQTVIFQRDVKPMPEALQLRERFTQLFPDKTFPIIQYNPLLASYVGPRATGVVVHEGPGSF